MKRILVLCSALILSACTPEDNKLTTPNVNSNSQNGGQNGPQKGLRVGSYGIPIFVAQNLEQVGALVAQCSASETQPSPVTENGEELLAKSCFIKIGKEMSDEDKKSATTYSDEKWFITIFQKPSSGAIAKATGHLMNGSDGSTFKTKPVALLYNSKGFVYTAAGQSIEIVIAASAHTGPSANVNEIDLAYRIDGKAQVKSEGESRAWDFSTLNFSMNIPDRKLSFDSSSQNLKLAWAHSQCANFSGEAQTKASSDKAASTIQLTSDKATLKGGSRPWEQTYQGCDKRQESTRNFEFLFF